MYIYIDMYTVYIYMQIRICIYIYTHAIICVYSYLHLYLYLYSIFIVTWLPFDFYISI